jgi:hypothetical protein
MNFDEELKLVNFKLITERQKYFTELAKDAFNIYLKAFVYIVTGAVALISLKEKIKIEPSVFGHLINILIFLTFVIGFACVGQISFCLYRWYRLKERECLITNDKANYFWAFLYEGFFIFIIVASWIIFCCNRNNLVDLINSIS